MSSMGHPCRQAFGSLADDVCDLLATPRVSLCDSSDERCSFEVQLGGTRFLVQHGSRQTGTFTVFSHFGPVLEGERAAAYGRLLEINLVLASTKVGATFGVDGETGDVVFTFEGAIAEFDGDTLLDRLDDAAQLAGQWRADRFVAASGGPLPAEGWLAWA